MLNSEKENKMSGVPDFFANSQSFKDQVKGVGVYSKDETVKKAAQIKQWENGARHGRITDLNALWAEVKAGGYSKENYASVKIEFQGSR